MEDTKFFMTIYAAVIATIALLWNIFSTIAKSRARLKVAANFGLRFLGDQHGIPLSAQEPTLKVVITNTGSITRFVGRPFFEVSRKLNGDNQFETLTVDQNFPVKIEPGEVFEQTYDLGSLNTEILQRLEPSDKLHFIVKDSLGKRFMSRKLKIKLIKGYYDAVNQRNARGA